MTTPDPETGPVSAEEPATTPPPSTRTRVLIALPLVVALLLAGSLLWTRSHPSARGSFCSRATLELTRIIHASEGSGRIDYNRTQQVDSALDLAYLADVSELRDGAPAKLREPLAVADRLLPAYRQARKDAATAGEPAPEAPQELADALNAFVGVYYTTCI